MIYVNLQNLTASKTPMRTSGKSSEYAVQKGTEKAPGTFDIWGASRGNLESFKSCLAGGLRLGKASLPRA